MTNRRRHQKSLRWLAAGVILGIGAIAVWAVEGFFHYRREAVIVVAPPILGAILLWCWPKTRRAPILGLAIYIAVMLVVVAGALWLVAKIASGRVIPSEILITAYFAFGWRMAWEIWRRTIGRIGQSRLRLARLRSRSDIGWPKLRCTMIRVGIPAGRASITGLVFVPFFFATVTTLRVKIGNAFDPQSYAGMEYEDAVFQTADGLTLRGWFIPSPRADSTVIICHGMGANKGNFFEFVRLFYGQQINALIFDFRGHGDSDGHTTGMGLLEDEDVRAAAGWLKKQKPQLSKHVFGIGSSMGAAALVRAAGDTSEIEAIVLDSCYASADMLADQHMGWIPWLGPLLARIVMADMSLMLGADVGRLSPLEKIDQLDGRPVLLIHAQNDRLIPPENLDILFHRAKPPKSKWLGPGTHSNVMTEDFNGYQDRVFEFLRNARSD